MTLYLCQFIALPDKVTLSEAVQWVAHRDIPLTLDPAKRQPLDMIKFNELGEPIRIAEPRNKSLGDIYNSERDTPNFIKYSRQKRDVSTAEKQFAAVQEGGHQELVEGSTAQAQIFSGLSQGDLEATGLVLDVLKPQHKGNMNAMSLNDAWIRRDKASTPEEEKLLSDAKEKWDDKPIDDSFWEMTRIDWEGSNAVSLRHGVMLAPILISTESLFAKFTPEFPLYLEMQLCGEYCIVDDNQTPRIGARKDKESGGQKQINDEAVNGELIRLYNLYGHDKNKIQGWYELTVADWYNKKFGKKISPESVKKRIQKLREAGKIKPRTLGN